ncbi:MAG: radical SAM protein [Bacillota bacterium]|nr:radical SAM protein [Bacillota bacterium]
MRYEGIVYRPPSEANSLIIQATIGCAHNKCSFCSMYKDKIFRIRSLKEIFTDLEEARLYYNNITRVFLADGDALSMKTGDILSIINKINELFPECRRIGLYGAPKDILRKTTYELMQLHNAGLGIIYMGVESGNDDILTQINKGVNAAQVAEAGRKAKESGIKLSVTLISGLGGKKNWMNHVVDSAKIINDIDPDYLGLLTLMLEQGTELWKKVKSGEFQVLSPEEVTLETKVLLQNLQLSQCVFRSNHASNYLTLAGELPRDKETLLLEIDNALCGNDRYRAEGYRRL